MKVRLELVHKNAKVKKVVLKADTVIGRSAECGLRIASNEVSRQHCKVCLSEDGVTVRDLGSSNGTFVNGYQLEEQTDYEIAPDSELSVGGIKFMVRFDDPKPLAMQTDGLGSTVDLKPHSQDLRERLKAGQSKADAGAFSETVQFEPAEEPVESELESAAETTETVPQNLAEAGAAEEGEVELEAFGDSAILERDAEPAEVEPVSEPVFPGLDFDQDVEQDSSLGEFFQKFE